MDIKGEGSSEKVFLGGERHAGGWKENGDEESFCLKENGTLRDEKEVKKVREKSGRKRGREGERGFLKDEKP